MSPNDELRWTCAPLAELAPAEAYDLLRLRSEVFVVEQRCAYLDLDGKDLLPGVWQLLVRSADGALLGCLRGLPPGLSFPQPALGRVAIAAGARGSGLGRALMLRGIDELAGRHPGWPIRIGAQAYLIRFYESLGFVVDSAPYDEDGIPHVEMQRPPRPASGRLSD